VLAQLNVEHVNHVALAVARRRAVLFGGSSGELPVVKV
jgi:hypothetical protein